MWTLSRAFRSSMRRWPSGKMPRRLNLRLLLLGNRAIALQGQDLLARAGSALADAVAGSPRARQSWPTSVAQLVSAEFYNSHQALDDAVAEAAQVDERNHVWVRARVRGLCAVIAAYRGAWAQAASFVVTDCRSGRTILGSYGWSLPCSWRVRCLPSARAGPGSRATS